MYLHFFVMLIKSHLTDNHLLHHRLLMSIFMDMMWFTTTEFPMQVAQTIVLVVVEEMVLLTQPFLQSDQF